MTIKEAIKILDPETTKSELAKYDYEEGIHKVDEACYVACEKLKELK